MEPTRGTASPHNRKPLGTALFTLLLLGSACAPAMNAPMPRVTGQLAVSVSDARPVVTAANAHHVPDTSIYFHPNPTSGLMSAFGLVGGLIEDAKKEGEADRLARRAGLSVDLVAPTRRVVANLLRSSRGKHFKEAGTSNEPILRLTPSLHVYSGSEGLPPRSVFDLGATMTPSDGNVWEGRYQVSLGEPRAFSGQGAWTSETISKAIGEAITMAVELLASDRLGQLRAAPRSGVITMELFPGVRVRDRAVVVGETADRVILVTHAWGVMALDREGVTECRFCATEIAPRLAAAGDT